jgi:hypothetical protein
MSSKRHITADASNTKHDEPGGPYGYIQSRKKVQETNNPAVNVNNSNQTKARMKYHKLANIGASNYILDVMSDSDDDEPVARGSAMSPPPIFDTPSIDTDNSESWFNRFQMSSANEVKKQIEAEEPSSWMTQGLKSVDDATTKASDWITNHADSNNWTLSSLSSYVPSINWSPFSREDKGELPTINKAEAAPKNTLAFLPKMASRAGISFGRNPFQAVIGRDTDYLLSSNTAYFWGLNWASNSWLTWMRNKTMRLIEATDETYQKAIERPKSQPSEASIQAVKNLLLLVESETSELKRWPTNASDASSTDTPCPLDGFPDIKLTPKDGLELTEDDPPAFEQNLSFDSCTSSYEAQSSPVRSSPVRPGVSFFANDGTDPNKETRNPNTAKNAEMASRLAEGTLRAYR